MTRPALRDVLWAVTLKAVLLATLYLCVIKPIEPSRADARSTAAAVMGAAADLAPSTSGQDRR
jgi:hypothetical protein